jgi:hypothetical protein
MYWLCFNTARENKAASRRIADFLNPYGLCRNLSFTAAISAIMLVAGAIYWRHGAAGLAADQVAFAGLAVLVAQQYGGAEAFRLVDQCRVGRPD